MTPRVTARDAARQIFDAALAAVDTFVVTKRALAGLFIPGEVELLAIGKAAAGMARGIAAALPVARGLVVTKDGHAGGRPLPDGIDLIEAAHPIPDARSLAAGRELLARAAACPADRTLVVAVSGGASALAVAPLGVPFADKVAALRAVAASGADIRALNAVRKHLSALKGGRLAAAANSPVLSLVLSDVVGDHDVATVGGGPAVPDDTTVADARLAIEGVSEVPDSVRAALSGAGHPGQETPKALPHVRVVRVAGPEDLLAAAAAAATSLGLDIVRREGGVSGGVSELSGRIVDEARRLAAAGRPAVALFGGEPTLRTDVSGPGRGPGRGGRAQHTALLAARGLRGLGEEVAVLAAGSDGTDGPTDDAGAIVDGGTWARIADPEGALARFDSGTALAAAGDLLTTGPTGTNLCDLYLVVVAPR